MKSHAVRSPRLPAKQRGVGTLLIAIVLLGILTVLTLFSLSTELYEQRTSTNESRYKLANEAAQAGLDQGVEYIKAMSGNVATVAGGAFSGWLPTTGGGKDGKWQYCGTGYSGNSTDGWSPCDTVDPTNSNSTVRSTYMYYTGGVQDKAKALTMTDGTGNLMFKDAAGTASQQTLTTMGSFPVDYEVKALLCLIDTNAGNSCHTSGWAANSSNWPGVGGFYKDPATGYGPYAVTLVSQSRLVASNTAANADTENAQAVVKATISNYRIINTPPDVPLIASGSVTGLGNAEIVTNPNGGGTGIPLSIWTDGCIHVTKADTCGGSSDASFATCQRDEFFLTGGATNYASLCNSDGQSMSTGSACNYQGSTVCSGNSCTCSKIANIVGNNKTPYGLGALSGHYGNNTVAGPDLLGVGVGGILPDTQFFPLYPLNNPPGTYDNSLFEYTFSQKVADNTSHLLASGSTDAATAWLTSNFTAKTDCSALNINSGFTDGFVYTPKGTACTLPGTQIGTPSYPLTLVVQGDFKFSAQTIFFGMIFVRCEAAATESLTPTGGKCNGYKVDSAGGGQLYGAMIIEGAPSLTGSVQLIYDSNTLQNIIQNPNNNRLGIVPGSWSDAGRINVLTGAYSE